MLTDEAVGVVPPQVLDHVARVARPLANLAVRLHRVHEMRSAVLQRNRIPVIVIHFGDEVHGVGIERKPRIVNDSEGVQLMSESSFGDDELGGVRSTTERKVSRARRRAGAALLEAVCARGRGQLTVPRVECQSALTDAIRPHSTGLE